ncbi:Bax inhibitor-1/YccA family protein [Veillonella criceti]|uniref:Inner membrane protein YbhL n=1 Tax=Veillonella criceti TaxID=103891 RepID=A0A380NMJ9_9FIRM|nr:Bax inhibitor-1/YccA family protein [Veillonella criceti]SUP44827.1 Inner membrane protein YbhL [Veillonella criceti]
MNYSMPVNAEQSVVSQVVARKLRNSMLWMGWGILTTFVTLLAALFNPQWLNMAASNYNIILLIELGVVILFSARQMSASLTALKGMFFIYSILNGLTLAVLSVVYGSTAFFYAFLGTVAFFGTFAIIGGVIKKDLTSWSTYLIGAVIALIVVSLLNMFFFNSGLVNLALGGLGVIIFTIFTAVDVNRIKGILTAAALEDDDVLERIELIGALMLYLDFINIFLSILRFFRRD